MKVPDLPTLRKRKDYRKGKPWALVNGTWKQVDRWEEAHRGKVVYLGERVLYVENREFCPDEGV